MKTFEEDLKLNDTSNFSQSKEVNHLENIPENSQIKNQDILSIRSTINELKKEIDFLAKKRRPSSTSISNYLNHITTYHNHQSNSSLTYKKNLLFFNKIIENNLDSLENYDSTINICIKEKDKDKEITSNPLQNSSELKPIKKLKKIGVTSEDISKISKYRINFNNLPRFGRITDTDFCDEINFEKVLASNSIGMLNIYNIANRKIKNTSSCIEKQNKDALKLIEQRRQKYKNFPKSNKEKMDNNRLKKYWEELIRHDIPKSNKLYLKTKNEREAVTKRFASLIEKEVKKKVAKQQLKAKKLEKEMIAFYRKKERENAENEKKKEKMEIEKKKKEDELREQIMQKKRMEYLLKQSDIYSLMMYKHLGAYMPQNNDENENQNESSNKENDNVNNKDTMAIDDTEKKQEIKNTTKDENKNDATKNNKQEIEKDENGNPLYKEENISGNKVLVNTKTNKIVFHSIRVDIDENQAKKDVQNMIIQQRQKAKDFDANLNKIRKTLGGQEVAIKQFAKEDTKIESSQNKNNININLNLTEHYQNSNSIGNNEGSNNDIIQTSGKPEAALVSLDKPMINNTSSQLIEVPKCFVGELKAYQLKGLRWLDNLYEQGINGILADEMGLGKTIEAISFLAHLSEEKNNWGPFLIIAPNATLYNWQQEFNKFCPTLKVLPYWGALKERKTLRKFFKGSQLYLKSSAFHVCITSYQLVVSDEKVFHKVNWNYMILDEAQAIKNITSQRWNVLLSFNCRNRLLLSGTPIQNSMSELWALLHFIMPNLFDSHEQFSEWFSKDIEAHSQNKGGLNQEQLNRLHKILKPFMLRRIKKDVEHEIGPKIEYEIPCEMTEKQKTLYNSIKEKLSNISDLFISTDSKVKVTNLMNLVMQFRKVCNHPELFERNFGKVPLVFRDLIADYSCSNTINLNSGEVVYLRINNNSIINFELPKIIYDLCFNVYQLDNIKYNKILFLYRYDNIIESVSQSDGVNYKGLFNFTSILGYSLSHFLDAINYDALIFHISLIHFFLNRFTKNKYYKDNQVYKKNSLSIFISDYLFPQEDDYYILKEKLLLDPLIVRNPLTLKNKFNHKLIVHRFFIPKVIAFLPKLNCSNTQLNIEEENTNNNLTINKILYGKDFRKYKSSLNLKLPNIFRQIINMIDQNGLMTPLFYQMEGYSQIELPSFDRLVSDCAKLKKLDELLKKLYQENHRVLIFCQMTHMIDILEEYMSKMKYTYFRMDGSTNIADRRDMINEFQTNDKIFAFLLSTRAGGLGVNLTGADTVIFYDNDWNPTMDAQATDRAHRIGQTKVVSVYRLITAGTIEERILKRAKQKQNVQTTVYSGGAFKADIFKQNDIVKLLYSEEEMQKMEMDKKRLLLELNNGEYVDENDTGFMGNNISSGFKGKKGKGKKDKKNKFKTGPYSNKKKFGNSTDITQNNSKEEMDKKTFGINKEIGNGDKIGKQIYNNAIKLDSDDENQVIIDDGIHQINFDDMGNEEFNEENEMSNE